MKTRPPTLPSSVDVLVVGARCAGAGLALILARAGARVLLVDKATPGTDTLSTHAIMRPGLQLLHTWGVLDAVRESGTPAITTTSFHYGDDVTEVPIRPRGGVEAFYAPRRHKLDALLAEAARKAGAAVAVRTRLTGLCRGPHGRVVGADLVDHRGSRHRIAAGLVVGADGARSSVAAHVGARELAVRENTSDMAYAYLPYDELDTSHLYFAPGCSAGLIPTDDGRACLYVSAPTLRGQLDRDLGPHVTFRRWLASAAPDLAARVDADVDQARLHRFGGRRGSLRQACGPGWALVGDAGFFRDPITSHGMTDAFLSAALLARAVLDDDLPSYAASRDALALPMLEATDRVASYAWDMDELRELHMELHDLMRAEERVIELLGQPPARDRAVELARAPLRSPRAAARGARVQPAGAGLGEFSS